MIFFITNNPSISANFGIISTNRTVSIKTILTYIVCMFDVMSFN